MNNEITGCEFRISAAAKHKITLLLKGACDTDDDEGLVPIITWISGIAEKEEFIPGPHLGLQEKAKIPSDYPHYYDVNSIRVYIMLDEKRVSECRAKVLDYRCKRFFLVYDDEFFAS